MPTSPLRLERPQPGIAVLTMLRARGPNVIDEVFCEALQSTCERLAEDDGLHAVVLRAEGPTFCVGADLGAMQSRLDTLAEHIDQLIDQAHAAVLALRRIPVPTIASVQAVAAGGGFSLAMVCDQVIAAPSARFVTAYPALGSSPDCGLTHTLAQRLGPSRALRLTLDTQPVDAAQARALGIIDEVAEPLPLEAITLAAARRFCGVPRSALVQTKALFQREDLPLLAARLDAEKAAFLRCVASPIVRERIADFGRGAPRQVS